MVTNYEIFASGAIRQAGGAIKRSVNLRSTIQLQDAAIDRTAVVATPAMRNPVVLKAVAVPPVPNVSMGRIGPQTIVPLMTNREGVASGTGMRAVLFPTSIVPAPKVQALSTMGVLLVQWGGKVVAQMAMIAVQQEVFSRIGKKLDNRLKFHLDTQRGEGRGRHVNVRGQDGATPGDQDDVYDEPSQWWEFWNWG